MPTPREAILAALHARLLADGGMEKPIELGRMRVENIGVGHRYSFQGLQELRSSLFPRRYAQVGLAALTQVSADDCPQEGRSRFGARD